MKLKLGVEILVLAGVFVTVGTGCSANSDTSKMNCEPAETVACECADGSMGTTQCVGAIDQAGLCVCGTPKNATRSSEPGDRANTDTDVEVAISGSDNNDAKSSKDCRNNTGTPRVTPTQTAKIEVDQLSMEFGGEKVGKKTILPLEIFSVGSKTLKIDSIVLAKSSASSGDSGSFELDFSLLPGGAPHPSNEVLLEPNESMVVFVSFVPNAVSAVGDNGNPIGDTAEILIESNSTVGPMVVQVSGHGLPCECPTAVIVLPEGDQVQPQTVVSLVGSESYSTDGEIASWKWSVQQPDGAVSKFVPSASHPNPTFQTNVSGEYVFSLEVVDQHGTASCTKAKQTVLAASAKAIHIELLWHTPNDPDESDEGPGVGSDLDLHFVHDELAATGPDSDNDGKPDVWFNMPFDSFWFNTHPNWGSFDPSVNDDPGLDRDDTDGAGPENLNLDSPEATTYRVGVHYWNDNGYGESFATVRVYIYGVLAFEVADVELAQHDMWDVLTIDWPSGEITPVLENNNLKITPSYQSSFFTSP